jgi:hypothetical protein
MTESRSHYPDWDLAIRDLTALAEARKNESLMFWSNADKIGQILSDAEQFASKKTRRSQPELDMSLPFTQWLYQLYALTTITYYVSEHVRKVRRQRYTSESLSSVAEVMFYLEFLALSHARLAYDLGKHMRGNGQRSKARRLYKNAYKTVRRLQRSQAKLRRWHEKYLGIMRTSVRPIDSLAQDWNRVVNRLVRLAEIRKQEGWIVWDNPDEVKSILEKTDKGLDIKSPDSSANVRVARYQFLVQDQFIALLRKQLNDTGDKTDQIPPEHWAELSLHFELLGLSSFNYAKGKALECFMNDDNKTDKLLSELALSNLDQLVTLLFDLRQRHDTSLRTYRNKCRAAMWEKAH